MSVVYEQINENYEEFYKSGNFKQIDQTKLNANDHLNKSKINLEQLQSDQAQAEKQQYILRAEMIDYNTMLQQQLYDLGGQFIQDFEKLNFELRQQIENNNEQTQNLIDQVKDLRHEKNDIDSQKKIVDSRINEIEQSMGFC